MPSKRVREACQMFFLPFAFLLLTSFLLLSSSSLHFFLFLLLLYTLILTYTQQESRGQEDIPQYSLSLYIFTTQKSGG